MLPKKLQQKLTSRNDSNSLRQLGTGNNLIDFSSNDYLGFSKSKNIFEKTQHFLTINELEQNGATGSRLLSGNHKLYEILENRLCSFHNCNSALVYNSGYDANIGFFSCVPQRGDIILYDEFVHASIRNGITLSNAKSYKFKHNDLKSLKELLIRVKNNSEIYVVTESVFSMNGDSPDLVRLINLCKTYQAYLIVDEAHSVGVFGHSGKGLIQELGIEKQVFARIITFGKAVGCHGAAILGNSTLKDYLVNFSSSLIYTTALSPHSVATVFIAYQELQDTLAIDKLRKKILFFKAEINRLKLQKRFINSNSAIQCCIFSGNDKVKTVAEKFQQQGISVKPILAPTVAIGKERLRFCLHAYNSEQDITNTLSLLNTWDV